MKSSIYIISKPLQYFNVSNIEDANIKILLIVAAFSNADQFYINVKRKSQIWDEVYFFETSEDALQWAANQDAEKIFIDGDYGLKLSLLLNRISADIFVYEEGVGSYNANLRKKISRNLKKSSFLYKVKDLVLNAAMKLIGNKDYHGGHKKTKGIYLYNRRLHEENIPEFNKQRLRFKKTFRQHLVQFEDREIISRSYNEFVDHLKGSRVMLYLSTWFIDESVLQQLEEYKREGCFMIFKPHPHIKTNDLDEGITSYFDEIIIGGSMAEFLINDLLTVVDQLIIVHHSSSALEYFKNEPKIIEVVI